MKKNPLRWTKMVAFALLGAPGLLFGQVAPGTATPAAPSAPAASSDAEKATPLTAADKKFIRDATKDLYFELALVDKCLRKNRAITVSTDAAKEVGEKLHPDLKKLWEELAAVAQLHNERITGELTGGNKNTVERLRILDGDKFNKEVLSLLGKEAKKLAQTFQSPAIAHPALRKIAQRYGPQLKAHVGEVEKGVAKLQ